MLNPGEIRRVKLPAENRRCRPGIAPSCRALSDSLPHIQIAASSTRSRGWLSRTELGARSASLSLLLRSFKKSWISCHLVSSGPLVPRQRRHGQRLGSIEVACGHQFSGNSSPDPRQSVQQFEERPGIAFCAQVNSLIPYFPFVGPQQFCNILLECRVVEEPARRRGTNMNIKEHNCQEVRRFKTAVCIRLDVDECRSRERLFGIEIRLEQRGCYVVF